MIRQLNSRTDNFVTVNLLWDDETEEVFVEVETDSDSEMVTIPPSEAMQAFHHPFVYLAANSHGHGVTV